MEEGALGATTDNPWYGKTYNPLKEGHTPGGSSGGSAAAVAAEMMPASLGTDTMGSVRIPSAYCGLVGHKPTYGLISMKGVMPLSPTLDHVGPHTRSVRDAVEIMNILTVKDLSKAEVDLSSLTIGKLEWGDNVDVDPDIVKALDDVFGIVEKAGATIQTVSIEGYRYGQARRAGLLVSEVEGAEIHVSQYEKNSTGFSEHFQSLMTWGVMQKQAKVDLAYARIEEQKLRAKTMFETYDILIAPTVPQRAFKFGDAIPANQADFTAFANFTGLPATAVPVPLDRDRLPASIQIIGPSEDDALTLAVAKQVSDLI